MSDKNASSSVGRDELAALLGASRASDLVAAANNDANKKSSLSAGLAPHSRSLNRKEDAEDVSKMDRAQAAALVAKKFGSGTQSAGGISRHRASGKRKRQYQLLAGDLTEPNNNVNDAVISSMEVEEGIDEFYDKGGTRKEEEDKFTINKTASGGGKRKKLQAKVLLKRGGDGNGRTDRRRRSYSDSSTVSSSSSSSQSSSGDETTNRSSRKDRRRRPNSSSSSSSSDEDEADLRRKRARAKAQGNQSQAFVVSVRDRKEDSIKDDSSQSRDKLDAPNKSIDTIGNKIPQQKKIDDEKITNMEQNKWKESLAMKKKQNAARSGSESSSSDDNDHSSTSSSSSSSSEDESEDDIAPISVSKPLFVPKSKRGTVAEVEAQQRKQEEAEERRIQEKEKRAVQSRALVAEAVSAVGKNGGSSHGIGDADEFDTGEVGGEFIPVPDDSDPVDEDSPELVLAERDAWEVRELIRILRDVDEAVELEKERKELERRRALTDEERLEEDRRSGRYRAPGEARLVRRDDERRDGSKSDINYLQRYHHRGAFYLDDDTLNEAGANDVRHRALEYSRSATGDRIDKRSLPEVMQVKNFGLAGYSTRYKGLSKEDTTDKRLDFLPIRGASAGKRDEKSGNNRYNQR